MNKYIVAIGGTGIKCLESFLYLNAINGLENENEVEYETLIIDSDENGNYKSLQESTIGYTRLREIFRESKKAIGQRPFANKFAVKEADGRLNSWRIVKHPSDTKIASLDPKNEDIMSLLEVLYEPGYKGELNMTLENGVHGKPKVGSLIMEYYLEEEKTNEQSEWGKFIGKMNRDIALCSDAEPLQVIIMGSVFGGTGASGLRTIANKIIDHKIVVNDDHFVCRDMIEKGQIKISVLMMLPYFNIPRNLVQEDDEYGLTDINANTAYALDYYKQDEEFMRKITTIVIGKSNYDEINDVLLDSNDAEDYYAEGGEEQCNRALIPELIASFAMDSFFSGNMHKDRLYYLARDAQEDYKIEWRSLPKTQSYLQMLLNMIVFSLIYRQKIYPVFRNNNRDAAEHPWLGICLGEMNSKTFNEDADKVYVFTQNFLNWISNISSCSVNLADSRDEYNLVDTELIKKVYKDVLMINDFTSLNNLVTESPGRRLSWANIHDEINKLGIRKANKTVKNQQTENSLDLLLKTIYQTIQKLN